MELISKSLPADYELVLSSDLHLGSPCVNEDMISEMVEYVATTPNCYHTNFGDNIEAIAPNDKRFAFSDTKYKTAHEQCDAVVRILDPIKDRTIAMGLGNHELKLANLFNSAKYICDKLNVAYGGYSYKVEFFNEKNNELMHKMFFTHGAGQITSNAKDRIQAKGNKMAALKLKLAKSAHADCILMAMGHIHKSIIVKPTVEDCLYLTSNAAKQKIQQHYKPSEVQNASYIPEDSRYYVANPSFMKLHAPVGSGYISYAEAFGLEPSEIGYTKVIVQGGNVVDVQRVIL